MASTDTELVLQIIIFAIPFTLDILLLISLLKQFYCSTNQTVHCHFKCTALVAFISSIIHCLTQISTSLYKLATQNEIFKVDNSSSWHDIVWSGAAGSMLMTMYTIYTILLLRLYHAFQESVYQIGKCEFFRHAFNISLALIANLLALLFMYFGMILFKNLFCVLWIILITAGFIDLTYQFNHNLFLLVVSQRRSIVSKQNTESIELNMRQKNMLSIVRKHTILGGFVIFGNVFYILFIVLGLIAPFDDVISKFIPYVLWNVFIVIAPLCVYLSFQQNEGLYRKCCNLCDTKCENICIALAENRLNQQKNIEEQQNIPTNGKDCVCRN